MQRRLFLLGSTLAGSAFGEGLSREPFGGNPWLQPFRGSLDGLDRVAEGIGEGLRVRGRLPAELVGTLYRNGPGLMERAGQRYAHWFDGDGLVQAWHFGTGGQVRHQARFVQTRKFKAEQRAGEFLVQAFGTQVPAKLPLRNSDDMNVANTSVTVQGGRLYALWEGGSAYELDPQTLQTLGPRAWQPELTGLPFSAHPKREPDGTLWNFGTFGGRLVLYQIGADGRLQRHQLLKLPAGAGAAMVHDFAVTQRWIVFLLPPLTLDSERLRSGRASFAGSLRWDGTQPMRAVVIDKASLAVHKTLDLPAQLLFHFGNAWDEGQHIHLDYVRTDEDDFLSGRFNSVLGGVADTSRGHSRMQFLRLDLAAGTARQAERPEEVEFPQVDPRVVGRRHRFLYAPRALAAPGPRWGMQAVQRLDLERQQTDTFDFGPDVVIEEQLLVPKRGSRREGQGWLVGTGFDAKAQRSFAAVFDAEALSAGPVARVDLPYAMPFGFHGHFEAA